MPTFGRIYAKRGEGAKKLPAKQSKVTKRILNDETSKKLTKESSYSCMMVISTHEIQVSAQWKWTFFLYDVFPMAISALQAEFCSESFCKDVFGCSKTKENLHTILLNFEESLPAKKKWERE